MREKIELGPTPSGEESVQVVIDGNYIDEMKLEVNRYLDLLRQVFPWAEEQGIYFRMSCIEHDFGVYYEASISYNEDDARQVGLAYFIENNTPLYWKDTEVIPMPNEENI